MTLAHALRIALDNGADLRGADLRGANLRWADLHWANLRNADLRGAIERALQPLTSILVFAPPAETLDAALKAAGVQPRFVRGLRVTDEATMRITRDRRAYAEALLAFSDPQPHLIGATPFIGRRTLSQRIALIAEEPSMSNRRALAAIALSLAATIGQWGLQRAALLTPMMESESTLFGGAVLIVAGFYQWTPFKDACLKHCRAPLHFIQHHGGFKRDAAGSLGMGFVGAESAALGQHLVHERGLAVVDVGDDGKVSQALGHCCLGFL